MSAEHIPAAAATLSGVADGVTAEHLTMPTPCTEYDVRALLNHLLFWGPSLAAAGEKQTLLPPAEAETDIDLTKGDWAADLAGQLERTVTVWSRPPAWQGVTTMGGPMEIPAPVAGGMLLGELVVHAWDLARATGQEPAWDDDLLTALLDVTAPTAELGRQMGIYGPEVPVPEGAPALRWVLGLVGRDPSRPPS